MPQWGGRDKRRGTPGNSLFTKPTETRPCPARGGAARRAAAAALFPVIRAAMLRFIVVALALLAGAKIWAQDRLYRDGAQDALILAYRERAIAACQSEQLFRGVGGLLWTRPKSVDVVIGRSGVDVHIWQLRNARWPARFKHPHVVLTLGDGDLAPVCQYDVIEGRAYVAQM
jgi:hypothetical protein